MTTSSSSLANASRIRSESASEWAGLELSTIIARKRSGWSLRISSGITLQGVSPPITGAPVTGVRPGRPGLISGAIHECMCCPPGLAKLPVRIQSILFR